MESNSFKDIVSLTHTALQLTKNISLYILFTNKCPKITICNNKYLLEDIFD